MYGSESSITAALFTLTPSGSSGASVSTSPRNHQRPSAQDALPPCRVRRPGARHPLHGTGPGSPNVIARRTRLRVSFMSRACDIWIVLVAIGSVTRPGVDTIWQAEKASEQHCINTRPHADTVRVIERADQVGHPNALRQVHTIPT